MAHWTPSNLDLQEMIHHEGKGAAAMRQKAADYYHRHLERTPEPGTSADFDREYHQQEFDRLSNEAEAYETRAAQFRGDLLARQRGGGPSDSSASAPAPGGPGNSPKSDADAIRAEIEAGKLPEPPTPKPAEVPTETKSRSR